MISQLQVAGMHWKPSVLFSRQFLHVCNMISNGIIKTKKCIMKNKKHGWET